MTTAMATKDDLTTTEAAALLNRSEVTLRRWIVAGTLAARRVGNRILVKRADVENLLAGEPGKAARTNNASAC